MKQNASIKILIVDDDHSMCELLRLILRREGYNVVGQAHDGEAALDKCARLEPDLVCLDIDMPKLSGMEVLQSIREAHPGVAVVMVSAESSMDVVKNAIQAGARGFIVKPFNAAKILDTIRRCTIESGNAQPSVRDKVRP